MAAKTDRMYFDNLIAAADAACTAADYLVTCLSAYDPQNIKQMLITMHEYEHAGDKKKHEMSSALAKAFVTPIDREDLALVSTNVDDVTDCIEEVLQAMYMYNLTTVTPEAVTFAKKIAELCTQMKLMLGAFANFKKPAKLHEMVVQINGLEEECDVLYMESIRQLNNTFTNVLDVISWRKIYDRMENCADACEHVGDSVETVVMKNS